MIKNIIIFFIFLLFKINANSQNKDIPNNIELSWGIKKYFTETPNLFYQTNLQFNRYINNYLDIYLNTSVANLYVSNILLINNLKFNFYPNPILNLQIGTKIYADEIALKFLKKYIEINDENEQADFPVSIWANFSSGLETYNIFKDNFWVNSIGCGIRYQIGKFTALSFQNNLSLNYIYSGNNLIPNYISTTTPNLLFNYNAVLSFSFDLVKIDNKIKPLKTDNYKIQKGKDDLNFKSQLKLKK